MVESIFLSILSAGVAIACHAHKYDVYELASPGLFGINNLSTVVGRHAFTNDSGSRPAIFKINESPEPIYTPSYGVATAINERDEVVGSYTVGEETYGFIARKGIVQTLPFKGGSMEPQAINNKSDIVGRSSACCEPGTTAWAYRDGRLIDFGTLGGTSAGFTDINQRGDIAGFRHMPDGNTDGFVLANGKMKSVRAILKVPSAGISSINNRGDTAGWMNDGSGTTTGFAIINNRPHKIEFGERLWGYASSINDKGQVVGFHADPKGLFTGFIWEKGKLTRIRDLPEVKAAGWKVIYDAKAINNAGVIIGNGYKEFNQWRGYMLVPRTEDGATP